MISKEKIRKEKIREAQDRIEKLLLAMGLTEEEKFVLHFESMAKLAEENNWGDPHSYARSKEQIAAFMLGHTISATLSGADAINGRGEEVEYKSTNGKKVKGSYTGISVFIIWAAQVRYLREKKILPYAEHYFNRFESGRLVESWMMTGQQVYDILVPKLKKKFATVRTKKDPRLSANITNKEILKYGVRVL